MTADGTLMISNPGGGIAMTDGTDTVDNLVQRLQDMQTRITQLETFIAAQDRIARVVSGGGVTLSSVADFDANDVITRDNIASWGSSIETRHEVLKVIIRMTEQANHPRGDPVGQVNCFYNGRNTGAPHDPGRVLSASVGVYCIDTGSMAYVPMP